MDEIQSQRTNLVGTLVGYGLLAVRLCRFRTSKSGLVRLVLFGGRFTPRWLVRRPRCAPRHRRECCQCAAVGDGAARRGRARQCRCGRLLECARRRFVAAMRSRVDIVKRLLAASADPNLAARCGANARQSGACATVHDLRGPAIKAGGSTRTADNCRCVGRIGAIRANACQVVDQMCRFALQYPRRVKL